MPESTRHSTNYVFWMGESAKIHFEQTVTQDAQRSGDMVWGTVMAYDPAEQEWVPWTDETATDGTQWPAGILLDTLAEADIQEGDVENVEILIGDQVLPIEQLTFENTLTKDTIINVPAGINKPAWRVLHELGLWLEETDETTEV